MKSGKFVLLTIILVVLTACGPAPSSEPAPAPTVEVESGEVAHAPDKCSLDEDDFIHDAGPSLFYWADWEEILCEKEGLVGWHPLYRPTRERIETLRSYGEIQGEYVLFLGSVSGNFSAGTDISNTYTFSWEANGQIYTTDFLPARLIVFEIAHEGEQPQVRFTFRASYFQSQVEHSIEFRSTSNFGSFVQAKFLDRVTIKLPKSQYDAL